MMRNWMGYLGAAVLCVATAIAGERRFVYTYEAEVLPKGVREIEIWSTYHYRSNLLRLANRIELEWGLGSNAQTAFYLNTVSSSGEQGGKTQLSISNAWVYQFLDVGQHGIASGLYGEWTLAANEVELELIWLGHTFVGNLLVGWNLLGKQAWEREEGQWEVKRTVAVTGGVSIPLSSAIAAGIEFVQQYNVAEEVVTGAPLFAGPVFSVRQSGWWATMTFLPQLVDVHRKALNLERFDRWQWRLLVSWIF